MRTEKQRNASRLNGSKSRGPITEAGKRRSSINARRHGLLSKGVVLNNEVDETFQILLQQHIDKFAPADDIEQNAIEEMTASIWRLRRLWMIEKHLLQRTMDSARNVQTINAPAYADEGDRIAAAFSELARGPELPLLGRYEARLHRMYQRALNNFLRLREFEPSPTEDAPPEPEPAPDPTPQAPDSTPHEPDPIPHDPVGRTPSSARGALAAFPRQPETSKQTRESLTGSPSSSYPVNSAAQFAQRCTTKTGHCRRPISVLYDPLMQAANKINLLYSSPLFNN